MKIICTGLSGLVGSRIVELLQNKHQFADFSLDSGVDITDELKLKKAFSQNQDAKTVIHLAAFTDVNEASKQTNDKNGLCYRILRIAFPYKAKAAATNLEPRVKLDLVRNIKEKLENGETIKIFGDQII